MIKWDETYKVDIEEIDKQHMTLFSTLNELNEAMRAGKGRTVLSKTIEELINYAKEHFHTEEKLFDKYSYPDSDKHKTIHTDFVSKVIEFDQSYRNGKSGVTIEIMNFLTDWLKNHIQIMDKEYAPFLIKNGVK